MREDIGHPEYEPITVQDQYDDGDNDDKSGKYMRPFLKVSEKGIFHTSRHLIVYEMFVFGTRAMIILLAVKMPDRFDVALP
jgi:hypothetical protein